MALFDVHRKAFSAFTLAELLMAVLVISIIMVALAPVITKRVSENLNITANTETRGQEIYTAPGDYEFVVPEGINVLHIKGAGGGGSGGFKRQTGTITKTFNSGNTGQTFTPPAGVEEVNASILGSGGAGGNSSSVSTYETCTGPNGSTTVIIPLGGSSTGDSDLCINAESIRTTGIGSYQTAFNGMGSVSVNDSRCYANENHWWDAGGGRVMLSSYVSGGLDQKCKLYMRDSDWFSLKDAGKYWNSCGSLMSCLGSAPTNSTDIARSFAQKIDMSSNNTYASCYSDIGNGQFSGIDKSFWVGTSTVYAKTYEYYNVADYSTYTTTYTAIAEVICAKKYTPYNNYSGTGGCSGALLEKTISISPGDQFRISVGSGGGSSGYAGGMVKLFQFDKNKTFITGYGIYGGSSGSNGGTNANGVAPTAGNQCRIATNGTWDFSWNGSNINCTTNSYCPTGTSGGYTKGYGGTGGQAAPSAANFGEYYTSAEYNEAKGKDSSNTGAGGGAGYGAPWARGDIIPGGKGGSGQIELTYKVNIPGGGGGGGAVVDGKAPDGKPYELKLKVTPGDKLKIHVGKGGTATVSSASVGEATTIGYNGATYISLNGGGLGKTSNSETVTATGGSGGGLSINSSFVKFSHSGVSTASFKGADGYAAKSAGTMRAPVLGYENDYAFQNNGIEGGMGSGCGGRLVWSVETSTGGQNNYFEQFAYGGGLIPNTLSTLGRWVSNTEKQNGQDGAAYKEEYNTTFNQYCGGGRGGGGAGSFSTKAGSGSHGYVVIRWDSAENEF